MNIFRLTNKDYNSSCPVQLNTPCISPQMNFSQLSDTQTQHLSHINATSYNTSSIKMENAPDESENSNANQSETSCNDHSMISLNYRLSETIRYPFDLVNPHLVGSGKKSHTFKEYTSSGEICADMFTTNSVTDGYFSKLGGESEHNVCPNDDSNLFGETAALDKSINRFFPTTITPDIVGLNNLSVSTYSSSTLSSVSASSPSASNSPPPPQAPTTVAVPQSISFGARPYKYSMDSLIHTNSSLSGAANQQQINMSSRESSKGKLEIKFLLRQDNLSEDSSKFGKIAQIIQTKDGIPKLFVVKGRVIDTRIRYKTAFGGAKNDHASFQSTKLKLRFTASTIFGGIYTPAIGYNDPVQGPNLIRQAQLCFIQAINNDDGRSVNYRELPNGYLVMETDFYGLCDIYHIVFPFLNSKCPTTWKKDVHITVSLIDCNETELGRTEFEVVSCASPIRDARRFLERQRVAKLEHKKDKCVVRLAKDTLIECQDLSQDMNDYRCETSPSEISPNTSGFGDDYSPMASTTPLSKIVHRGITGLAPLMTKTNVEDCVSNELQLYLSSTDVSDDLNQPTQSTEWRTDLISLDVCDADESKSQTMDHWADKQTFKLCANNQSCDIDSTADYENAGCYSDRNVMSGCRTSVRMRKMNRINHSTMQHARRMNNRLKRFNESNEYIIRTKSRPIYNILNLINRELSKYM